MKHTPIFFSLFLLLALTTVFSCRKEHRPNAFIAQLEKTVQTAPEEALRILNHADKNKECPTTADQMDLKLMTIRINDKNFINQTNDKTINEIEKYYKNNRSNNELSAVYYYKAAYYRDRYDYMQTMEWLQKALNIADTTAIDFNADIYSSILANLAGLCIKTSNYKEGLMYAQKASNYANRISSNVGLYQMLGAAYSINNMDDSATIYYDKAFNSYKKGGKWDKLHQYQINLQIFFLLAKDDWSAINDRLPYFKKDVNIQNQELNNIIWARYYEKSGLQDSALILYHEAEKSNNINIVYMAYQGLYRINRALNIPQKAYGYADKIQELRDTIDNKKESDRILNMSKLYNFNKLKQEKVEGEMKAAGEKAQLLEAIIIVLVILWIFVIAFYFYRKRLKRQISTTSQQLRQTVMIKEEMEERLENIRRRQNDLILALHDCLNKHISPGPKLTRDLENFCQAEFPDVHRIAQEGTKKSAAISVHFYCLREIGFSEQEIATLFGNSRQNVHNICRRLQTKLENATTHLPQAAEEEPTEKIAEDEKTMINGNEG